MSEKVSLILVVDDEKNTRGPLLSGLEKEGYLVIGAETGEKALEIVRKERIDLILAELKLPGMDGLTFLRAVKTIRPHVAIIILTGHGTIDTAVTAMKEGAYDYVTKPVRMPDIQRIISKTLETRALKIENALLRAQLHERYGFKNIIGTSQALNQLLEMVQQIAPTRSTVFLTGESGTGKELIAHAIHFHSNRSKGPYIKVNCAALPETLLEAELFGYEKGAFTGALRQKPGRFELADGGTLFLDEVTEISLATQAKLLRVLQDGEFERVGGTRSLKVDVRIIAATNKNLEEAVQSKTFRDDLYYRLNVIELHLPPLRERREDIPLLVNFFIEKYGRENGKSVTAISQEAREVMLNYAWPGNIRELENAIEHAVALTKSETVSLENLPALFQKQKDSPSEIVFPIGTSLREIEQRAIMKTLQQTKGDKEAAARLLGIGIATLYRKLKEINLP